MSHRDQGIDASAETHQLLTRLRVPAATVMSVGESSGSKTRPPTVAPWRTVAQPDRQTSAGLTGGWDGTSHRMLPMLPNPPRRVLLHETPDTQVWLDLDTGRELTLPRHKPTLTEAVEQFVRTMRVPFEWEDDSTISLRLIGAVLTPRMTISALEDRRAVVFELDLQVCVPETSRSLVLETLALLGPYVNLPVLMFGDPPELHLRHVVDVGAMEPTTDFLRQQFVRVMDVSQPLHLTLASVIAGGCAPAAALELWQTAVRQIAGQRLVKREDA